MSLLLISSPLTLYTMLTIYYDNKTPIYRVDVKTMEPTLHVGDLILVSHRELFDGLKPGDIILYKSTDDKIIIQRIIEIRKDPSGQSLVRVSSDSSPSDPNPNVFDVGSGEYVGRVVGYIPLGDF